MKNQQHVFLLQEGEITALYQRSCVRGCWYNCKESPPLLPSTCVSSCPLLPLGMGSSRSCSLTRVLLCQGRHSLSAERFRACEEAADNAWRRPQVLWEQRSAGYQHSNNAGDRWTLLKDKHEMVKSTSQNHWTCLATKLSNSSGCQLQTSPSSAVRQGKVRRPAMLFGCRKSGRKWRWANSTQVFGRQEVAIVCPAQSG